MEELSPAAILLITILVAIAAWYAWPHVCGSSHARSPPPPPTPAPTIRALPPAQPSGAPVGAGNNTEASGGSAWGWGYASVPSNKSPVEAFCGAAHASCGF